MKGKQKVLPKNKKENKRFIPKILQISEENDICWTIKCKEGILRRMKNMQITFILPN